MIDINLFNLIGTAYLGNMIAYDFTPIQPAKQKFINFFPLFISSRLDKLLNCSKCVSFWTGFIIYQNILHAALAGLTGFIINYLLDRIKEYYHG